MDNSFFAYLQLLELMAFFAGYPLLYAIILSICGRRKTENNLWGRMARNLPFAYALVATLYFGYVLKSLYPDYSINNFHQSFHQPWLVTWGLIATLFWLPGLAKKKILSLIHGLVFFFFLLNDLFSQITDITFDGNILRNDMKVYTTSLLLNLGAFAFVIVISGLRSVYKKRYAQMRSQKK